MADPHEHDDDFTDGYFDDNAYGADGASELLTAKHLHDTDRREKALKAAKARAGHTANSNKSMLRQAFDLVRPAPLAHIKRNWKTILGSTVAAGALATGNDALLNETTNFVNIGKTALLGYPAYKLLRGGFQELGTVTGHALNYVFSDKLRQYRTTSYGQGLGIAAFATVAFMGGQLGDKYFDAVENVTIRAPHTITQGIPSAIVDTFTTYSNTSVDPIWELKDQGNCLVAQAADPEHICLDGPGSQGITVSVDGTTVTAVIDTSIITPDALENNEMSWFERKGWDFELPDILPEAEDVNAFIHQQLSNDF